MKTITRAVIAAVAGLAIIGDAFLLFVKPHLAQQAASGSGLSLASGNDASASGGNESGSASGNSGSTGTDSGSGDSSNAGTSSDSADSSSSSADTDADANNNTGNTLKDGTYTSVASPNAYGEIQLQVKVEGGKITTITTVKAPTHGRSQSVNAQAIPELTDRAISAQSSDIQFVSGATETSTAFVNSLQDAINQAQNAGN
ncbi:FMN-binding domain-containing protein [Bifidobacterium myosotis]|uniref:FMN-binding domain-containing protein n=1 Tax=Bifidobacterium myosotis TaxID=1630166 RepID=A0A261FKZ5_9BIFI|nr:FMN-binding protein [Bifidobacterium myosotis]OZG59850.1 FMN-binding domain-containing protein [Bifidobacterium myosotis]